MRSLFSAKWVFLHRLGCEITPDTKHLTIITFIVTTGTSIPVRQLVMPNETEGTMDIARAAYWFTDSDVTDQNQSFVFHGVNFAYGLVPLHFLKVVIFYNGIVKTTGSAGPPISSYKYEPYVSLTDDSNG